MTKSESQNTTINRYFNMVYKLALSQTKNIHNAEDVVQNVFLKFIQHSHNLESEDHQKAWLIRVTINECKSFFSTAWFRKTVPLDDNKQLMVFDNEEKSDVYYATLRLPPKYRAVIHLFYYEDMSISEIAKTLRQKDSTVKTQLHRGRELLKKYLEGGYEDV